MALKSLISGAVAYPVTFILLLGASAQGPDSISTILPAATTLPKTSPAGTPLFGYETAQLTNKVVKGLSETKLTTKYASIFAFDDEPAAARSGPSGQSGACKVFPGDEAWPAGDVWDVFNQILGKALIPTVPLYAPCYQNWGIYDAAKCASLITNYSDPYLHESDPTSNMWPIFQGRTCLAVDSPNGKCTLGGYPAYSVNVSSVAQVQLAVNFARNLNLRLVIKNTGHDYLGKSTGAGSLSVWTHNLKDIEFIPDYQSVAYSGKALKVGAGVTVREVYKAAHKYGVTALGGICESVGFAGGYLAGGGHTPMSGLYGMAADNVEALEVVTADGRFLTASPTSNKDLFWALRGGGGSTFGIVTSVIVRVHPKVFITTSTFTIATSANVSVDVFWQGMRAYFELFIPFTDAGTYSYFWVYNENGSYRMEMMPFFAPNHTVESFNKLVKPWFDRLTELGIPFSPNTTYYEEFYPAFDQSFRSDSIGRYNLLPGNRLFPRGNWEDPAKFNATFDVLKTYSKGGLTFGGYHQAPRNRLNVDNAVSSAFRHVISFLIAGVILPENFTPEEIKAGANAITHEILEPWRAVAPSSEFGGSYLNEANVLEPNWQADFYGVQYPRLLELKRKWDPKDVFYATTAVGSERWEVRDGDQGTQTQNGKLCRL